jgi:hypothetical protein
MWGDPQSHRGAFAKAAEPIINHRSRCQLTVWRQTPISILVDSQTFAASSRELSMGYLTLQQIPYGVHPMQSAAQ